MPSSSSSPAISSASAWLGAQPTLTSGPSPYWGKTLRGSASLNNVKLDLRRALHRSAIENVLTAKGLSPTTMNSVPGHRRC